ncbi:DNA mismatch repair protein [Planctomycetes bacterium Poly30]|uniref:DNA mismatch repair protein n=1 Tax=Saltatorellus ferox TaxID=2528018 RepID=A0A518ELU3_9BACT|nr:DNA mismatch repair protein [Planctomycetes bacterium Poly30]
MASSSRKAGSKKSSAGEGSRRVKLRPQDPFDLIRLLARSQSDPRKALAELVQNSLDAGARRIEIQWFNDRGRRALSIWDDGAGVFPDLDRSEALRRIAQTIGHSHKRDLTPSQRREELILGKYGIGLIGFWSVGEVLEMRSRVGGEATYVLRMQEEREQGEVFASRSRRLDETDTFTEVTIRQLHETVLNKIKPARLQAFLATELRGQLLDRRATVRIRDRISRGRARKEFLVQPQPYLGRPIEGLSELEVPGYESARLELYLISPEEDRRGTVVLSCGGTVVLDDIAEIDGVDALRKPWTSGRFEGVIDFPDLHVAPASRRGFSYDEPVAAFLAQLSKLESDLALRVESESERRAALRNQQVARQIRKAFASVAEALPDYDFFDVQASLRGDGAGAGTASGAGLASWLDGAAESAGEGDDPEGVGVGSNPPTPIDESREARPPSVGELPSTEEGASESAGAARKSAGSTDLGGSSAGSASGKSPASSSGEAPEPQHLFPPGPLASIKLRPARIRLTASEERQLSVTALDADGRTPEGEIEYRWRVEGVGQLDAHEGSQVTFKAPDRLPEETRGSIVVSARTGEGADAFGCEAQCSVTVTPPDISARIQGIPEPHPVAAPGESWRSRFVGGRWEFNESHRDFLAVSDVEAQRVRYLIHLFVKEVVLRNFGRPGDAEVLERMVEVLTRL